MASLHQIIALVGGRKSRAQEVLTKAYHAIQKSEPLQGLRRTYLPKDDEGEKLPAESKRVQVKVPEVIQTVRDELAGLFNGVATMDEANRAACGDVMVDDKVLLAKVSITTLLFLEKRLVDIHTFVSKLPTLDPADDWTWDAALGCYSTAPSESVKTKKIPRNHIKYEATKEHPAQVELFNEDVAIGHWTTVKYSGAIQETDQRAMLARVRKLQEAVKTAREEANGLVVDQDEEIAEPIFGYVFGTAI